MAVIDFKRGTIKLWDGVKRTLTVNFTATEADIVLTEASRHFGSYPPSITFVDPGSANAALSVVVTDRDIVVNLATNAMSAITTTATQLIAALQGSTAASALVTVALNTGEDGSGIVNAQAKASLTTGSKKSITIKTGNGNLTYRTAKAREVILNRGVLDTIRDANQEVMQVTLDTQFEYITAVSGGTETVEDALNQLGEASDWVSTADDQCQPYCVDLEYINDPPCSADRDEVITFEEFYWQEANHDFSAGTIPISGICNRLRPSTYRPPVVA